MKTNKPLFQLSLSMVIFSTIGIVRNYMDMPSAFISLGRAAIGVLFLLLLAFLTKRPPDLAAVRKNLSWLLLSGACLGLDWTLLFESYRHTTVATATLCYYMCPSLVVLGSHFIFKERLTVKKGLCVLVAFLGMVLVSGFLDSELPSADEIQGVLLSLAGAVFYAGVVLLNKKIHLNSSLDKTIFQLALAGCVLAPYVLMVGEPVSFSPINVGLLLVLGVIHTGTAFALYFGSVEHLSGQTAALFSYIDPILAIVLSALILGEPLGVSEIIGSCMILGAAIVSEQ